MRGRGDEGPLRASASNVIRAAKREHEHLARALNRPKHPMRPPLSRGEVARIWGYSHVCPSTIGSFAGLVYTQELIYALGGQARAVLSAACVWPRVEKSRFCQTSDVGVGFCWVLGGLKKLGLGEGER